MSSKTHILITGVTGYIGGAVLARFLEHPDFASFKITTLVRSPEKAEKLKALGVGVVVGSHSNKELMEGLAADRDVVFAMADADNLEAATAILSGLKKRHATAGTVPIFIETSGTGCFTDKAEGSYSTETIYDDANPDQIETLPDIQRRTGMSTLRFWAQIKKSYIVFPAMIWGIASGVLVEKGIQNPHSIQVPDLIRASLARGQGGMVGGGKNMWPNVNIEEVADLYIVLFNSIRANPSTGHGREGIYFGENGEHRMYQVAKAISKALVGLGRSDKPEPSSFTKEEIDKYSVLYSHSSNNSRCRGNRSRVIGWKPVKTTEDFLVSIKPEVEALAKKWAM